MAMKETEGSLRAYLVVAGVISVLLAQREYSSAKVIADVELPLDWTLAIWVPIISKLALGVAFVIAGFSLKRALLTGASWIKKMLVVSGAMLFINGALITAVVGTEHGSRGIGHALIGLLITIYLHRSVVRLSAEASARAGISPPPPAAKVI
jgi:hypothetical protein